MSTDDSILAQIITVAESAALDWLKARILVGMGLAAGTWYFTPVAWLVGLAAGVVVKYGDVLAFMLVDGWETTRQGKAFLDAADARANLPGDATDEERQAAEQAEMAAFAHLIDMGTN